MHALSPSQQPYPAQGEKRHGTRLRNLGDTEPDVGDLVRRVAVAVAGRRVQVAAAAVLVVERPAPQAAIRISRALIDNCLIPLPNVPALIKRAVGAVGQFELAHRRAVVRTVDRVAALVVVGVVAAIGRRQVVARRAVAAGGVVPVAGIRTAALYHSSSLVTAQFASGLRWMARPSSPLYPSSV